MKERAKQLASEHWDKYVGPMLLAHGCETGVFNLCEFHYKTSAVHFHGHGVEDERNRARATSNAAFENDTPIAAYNEAVEMELAKEKPAILCTTCKRDKGCAGGWKGSHADNYCEGYIEIALKTPTPLSICAICAKADASCPTYPQETQHCAGFRDKVEREALDLTLPSYALPCTAGEAHAKYLEECEEWGNCIAGSMESLIEAWDIRQAAQTWDDVSQSAISTIALVTAGNRLAEYYNHGEDVMGAKYHTLAKNAVRGYYSESDNTAITCGTWEPT